VNASGNPPPSGGGGCHGNWDFYDLSEFPRSHDIDRHTGAVDGNDRKRIGFRLSDITSVLRELTAPGALEGQTARSRGARGWPWAGLCTRGRAEPPRETASWSRVGQGEALDEPVPREPRHGEAGAWTRVAGAASWVPGPESARRRKPVRSWARNAHTSAVGTGSVAVRPRHG
jgi:hypothetical protein